MKQIADRVWFSMSTSSICKSLDRFTKYELSSKEIEASVYIKSKDFLEGHVYVHQVIHVVEV